MKEETQPTSNKNFYQSFKKKKNPSFFLFPFALLVATTIQYSEKTNMEIIMYFFLHSQQCYFSLLHCKQQA